MAMDTPSGFVLKPQREGGGNNFFDGDLARVLGEAGGGAGRAAYVLMDRVQPRVERNVLLKKHRPPELCAVALELGIFGAYIRNEGEMVLNTAAGQLIRTKGTEHDQDGVSVGSYVNDSLLLF